MLINWKEIPTNVFIDCLMPGPFICFVFRVKRRRSVCTPNVTSFRQSIQITTNVKKSKQCHKSSLNELEIISFSSLELESEYSMTHKIREWYQCQHDVRIIFVKTRIEHTNRYHVSATQRVGNWRDSESQPFKCHLRTRMKLVWFCWRRKFMLNWDSCKWNVSKIVFVLHNFCLLSSFLSRIVNATTWIHTIRHYCGDCCFCNLAQSNDHARSHLCRMAWMWYNLPIN